MALSGSVNGGATNQAYLRLEWSASQSIPGNYSTVTASLRLITGNYYSVSSASFSMNVEGNVGSGSHPAGTQHGLNMNQLLLNYGTGITHNANGNRSFGISGSYNDAYFGTLNVSGSWALDTIPRYAAITSFAVSNVTDASFDVGVIVDNTCDVLQYSLNSGSSWTTVGSGTFTLRNFTVSDLNSGTAYIVRVKVRRSDSGLYTETGNTAVTTEIQNKFFDNIGEY